MNTKREGLQLAMKAVEQLLAEIREEMKHSHKIFDYIAEDYYRTQFNGAYRAWQAISAELEHITKGRQNDTNL